MLALGDELRDEFGPLRVFRPNRDIRFSKDKSPYKTQCAASTEGEGGEGYYVSVSADGLFVGGGYYQLASDQLERYRSAVAGRAGEKLPGIVSTLRAAGIGVGGEALKTAPRGYPKDHPRAELLRYKGIYVHKSYPPAKWLATHAALDRITSVWRAAGPLNAWLNRHVGPSKLAPELD
jgi:uncharacterized protein (TIGR02453 family)